MYIVLRYGRYDHNIIHQQQQHTIETDRERERERERENLVGTVLTSSQ
jgi:hypothetical protein